ncbi:single-stranded DNA-binding protein [Pseudomonas aeruginosa]|uniref:single-stranded DNA-binding protein n=1 Tax=Pseudomonas aeruginosa TaxID=287 RepID=UPI00071B0528|nr:single-stranded DNA-binding protein [Pseudomonas aeruginosa]
MHSIFINSNRLMGVACDDPVSHQLRNGNKLVKVSLFTKRRWMTDEGRKEATDFHNIAFFGKAADEALSIRKGVVFSVLGRNQTHQFEDSNGGPMRYRTEIVVDAQGELQILGVIDRKSQECFPFINSNRLMGVACGDPVSEPLSNGNKVVKLSLQTKRSWTTSEGRKETTDVHNIAYYGKAADEALTIRKGMIVSVLGRNQTHQFEDANGGPKRYLTEVVVDSQGELQIGGFTGRSAAERTPKPTAPKQLQQPPQPVPQVPVAVDERPYVDDWTDGLFGGDDYIPFLD